MDRRKFLRMVGLGVAASPFVAIAPGVEAAPPSDLERQIAAIPKRIDTKLIVDTAKAQAASPGFTNGGVVHPTSPILVGEKGPELFINVNVTGGMGVEQAIVESLKRGCRRA